jgi:hypothetical protein
MQEPRMAKHFCNLHYMSSRLLNFGCAHASRLGFHTRIMVEKALMVPLTIGILGLELIPCPLGARDERPKLVLTGI